MMSKDLLNSMELYYPGRPFTLEQMENTPHLKPLAKAVRDIHSADKYLRDKDFLNNKMFFEFIRACNDYIFFLKYFKLYDILEALLKDPKLTANLIRYLHEVRIMERQQQQQQVQQPGSPIIVKITPNPVVSGQEIPFLFVWTHPDPALSNFEKHLHYTRELDRITVVYHTHRMRIHNEALTSDLIFIDRVLVQLNLDREGNSDAIHKFTEIRHRVITQQQEIRGMSLPEDGTLDAQVMTKQISKVTNINDDIYAYIASYESDDPGIHARRAQWMTDRARRQAEFELIDKAFLQAQRQVKFFAQKHQVLEHKDSLIGVLSKYSLDGSQLNKSLLQLDAAPDENSIASSLELCQAELQKVELTAAQQLPEEAYKAFKAEVDELSKIAFAGLPPLVPRPDSRISPSFFGHTINKTDAVLGVAQNLGPSSLHERKQENLGVQKNENPTHPELKQKDQENAAVANQQKIKVGLINGKSELTSLNVCNEEEVLEEKSERKESSESDALETMEELQETPEELRDEMKKQIEKIKELFSEALQENQFPGKFQQIIQDSIPKIKSMETHDYSKFCLSDVQSLIEVVTTLSNEEDGESFKEILDELESLVESLEEASHTVGYSLGI